MLVPVKEDQIKYNTTPKKRLKDMIKKLVIHYTANYNPSADDIMHFKFWNSRNRNSSCDIVIDQDSVYKINDWYNNYTWQIGDGKGRYGLWNNEVIGIEICVNGNIAKAVENTIWYIREYIFKELPHLKKRENIVRHYDCSRKLCPIWMVDLSIREPDPDWVTFLNALFDDNYKTQKTIIQNKNWKDTLNKKTDNPKIWTGITNLMQDFGDGNTKALTEFFKYQNSFRFVGDLIEKIDGSEGGYEEDSWFEITKRDLSSPKIWNEIITGCHEFGKNKATGIQKLLKNQSSCKYFGTMLEKVEI